MKTRHTYKGHIVELRAYPLRGGGWTGRGSVETHRGFDVIDRPFQTGRIFPTQDAALEASLRMGMHVIDTGFDAFISG